MKLSKPISAAPPPSAAPAAPPGRPRSENTGFGRRGVSRERIVVLLIEDDPEDTAHLTQLLAHSGWPAITFTLLCATTLSSALELLSEEEGIDIILLDPCLPDSVGATFASVRAASGDIPIMLVVGPKDEQLGLDAALLGAQDYQIKGGTSAKDLKHAISEAVQARRLGQSRDDIMEESSDGIVISDSKGIIRSINPAAESFFGAKTHDLLGRPFPCAMPLGPLAELSTAAENGGPKIGEVRKSNTEWNGKPATLTVILDITDLRHAKRLGLEVQESVRRDKRKDHFISELSHEMRNPLSVIRAVACTLKEGLAGVLSAKQTQLVQMAQNSSERLLRIVDNILKISKLEADMYDVRNRRLNAAHMIREIVREFQLVAAKTPITIRAEIAASLPPIRADAILLAEVLSNLIGNALRFAKGEIVVRAELGEAVSGRKEVKISVTNDGEGIDPSRFGDLFNKFVQLGRHHDADGYRGTGLGLSICKELIQKQGGTIWIENVAGLGARFNILLPQFHSA